MTMGADEAAGIQALGPLCAPPPVGATGPADGICDIGRMMALCSAPGTEINAACEADTSCLCANDCVLEVTL